MKTIDKKSTSELPKVVYIEDETLIRFSGKNLFPEKVALAKERFKNVVLPPR